jgi:hypothetical protein
MARARNGRFYAKRAALVTSIRGRKASSLRRRPRRYAYATPEPCMNVSTKKANAMRHAASAAVA